MNQKKPAAFFMKAKNVTAPTKTPTPERIELPGGYYIEREDAGRSVIRHSESSVVQGIMGWGHAVQAFAAAMNRPTDGLREALDYGIAALEAKLGISYTTFSTEDGWGRTNDKQEQLARIKRAKDAISATPQAPADHIGDTNKKVGNHLPPVPPSDEEGPLGFSERDMDAAHKTLVICGGFMGLQTQQNVAALFAAHRTAHQNAADDGWRDIESAPTDGQVWVCGGSRIKKGTSVVVGADGDFWRREKANGLASIPTHWMPYVVPTPPRNGRAG